MANDVAVFSSLDPIFPLPAHTGIVRDGRPGWGAEVLENDEILQGTGGMTYRAFWHLWEMAELKAAKIYPRYVGGPMDHTAQMALEMVTWCRRIAYPSLDIVPISEKKAQKIRTREIEEAKKAAAAKAKKSAKGKSAEPAPEPEKPVKKGKGSQAPEKPSKAVKNDEKKRSKKKDKKSGKKKSKKK